jgi:hypothetical protein
MLYRNWLEKRIFSKRMFENRTIIEFFEHKFKFSPYFFLLTALGLQLYVLSGHLGITHDSQEYLAAAMSFRELNELRGFNTDHFISWPPLFPILISLGGKAPILWVSFLHMLCLSGSLMVFFKLGDQLGIKGPLKIFYQGSLAWGIPILMVHVFLWSEPFFIFLLGLKLLIFFKYLRKPSLHRILFLALLAFLLCMQRNAGIFFVAPLSVCIWFYTPASKRWLYSFLYGVGALLFFLFWNSQLLGETPEGDPSFSYFIPPNAFSSLFYYLNYGSAWFLPRFISLGLRIGILFSVMVCLIFYFKIKDNLIKKIIFAASITMGFYLFILLLMTGNTSDDVERLLAVIYPMFMLLTAVLLNGFQDRAWTLLLVLWLLYPLGRSLYNIGRWKDRTEEFSMKARRVLEEKAERKE